MKLKQLLKLIIRKDNPVLGDIIQRSIDNVKGVDYNPICGIEYKKYEEEEISKVLRKTRPITNVRIREISYYD